LRPIDKVPALAGAGETGPSGQHDEERDRIWRARIRPPGWEQEWERRRRRRRYRSAPHVAYL
jgi:hypothetical protein